MSFYFVKGIKKARCKPLAVLKNAKHEKYVQNLIAGMSQRVAYRDAFPNSTKWKDATVDNKASKLLNGEVLARYQELLEQQKDEALLTRWEKRKILADIARNEIERAADRTRAIDLDNKMEGEYTTALDVEMQKASIELMEARKESLTGENEIDESLEIAKQILEELKNQ